MTRPPRRASTPPRRLACWTTATLVALALLGCGVGGFDTSAEHEDPSGFDSFNDSGATDGQGAPPDAFTPPAEEELELQAPEAARDFVFVASIELDSVAQIDARTLEIESVEVGDRPTVVRTRRALNTAVVLNLGSGDVTLIHADPEGETRTARVVIEPYLNQLALSPTGAHALAYYDEATASADDPVGSFQVVSIVRATEGQEASVTLPVSFGVRDVRFDASGARAIVITEDHLHVIALEAALGDPTSHDPGARLALADDVLSDALDREVVVSDDGRLAMVRSLTAPTLRVIDLESGQATTLTLPALPTDLDLLPDGSGALVVVREDGAESLLRVPLPEALSDPLAIHEVALPEALDVGQAAITPDGAHALLFSTADERATLALLRLDDESFVLHRLGSGKAIRGATLSPTGEWALIRHEGAAQDPDPIQRSEGFSLLRFPPEGATPAVPYDKFIQTDAPADAFLFSDDGGWAFALAPDALQLVRVELASLHHEVDSLGSPPTLLGAVPAADRVYVSQQHPVGRISFVEVTTGQVQTVTGFELNSRTQ